MDENTKEFFLQRVNDFNSNKQSSKREISGLVVTLGSLAVSAIFVTTSTNRAVADDIQNFITIFRGGSYLVLGGISARILYIIIERLADIIGANVRTDEIRIFFEQHGLVLKNEIKGKAR